MARSFGAEGIGLCRTEHMFFDEDRIVAMREMILADTEKDRRSALDKLLPMQRSDFLELFEIMAGLPSPSACSIRRCTSSCPRRKPRSPKCGGAMNVSAEELRQRTEALQQTNPMLLVIAAAGCVSYPEVAEVQARAIFEAAVEAAKKTGAAAVPEVMVPLVGLVEELDFVEARIDLVAKASCRRTSTRSSFFLVGTMIELLAQRSAPEQSPGLHEFFSFDSATTSPNGVRHLPRRRPPLSWRTAREGHHRARSVRHARHRSRRRTGWHGVGTRARAAQLQDQTAASPAGSAAIPPRSASARRSGSITCRARLSACRSPNLTAAQAAVKTAV